MRNSFLKEFRIGGHTKGAIGPTLGISFDVLPLGLHPCVWGLFWGHIEEADSGYDRRGTSLGPWNSCLKGLKVSSSTV